MWSRSMGFSDRRPVRRSLAFQRKEGFQVTGEIDERTSVALGVGRGQPAEQERSPGDRDRAGQRKAPSSITGQRSSVLDARRARAGSRISRVIHRPVEGTFRPRTTPRRSKETAPIRPTFGVRRVRTDKLLPLKGEGLSERPSQTVDEVHPFGKGFVM